MKPLRSPTISIISGARQVKRRRRRARARRFAREACRARRTASRAQEPVFDRVAKAGGAGERQAERPPGASPWAPKPVLLEPPGGIAAGGRAGQARGHVGQSSPKLTRAAARKASRKAASRLRTPRGGTRRCARAGGDAAAGVPPQRIRGARRRDPLRAPSRSRTMSAPPSRAFSRRFSRRQVVKRAADELARAIARLCAGGSPGLIKICGPERVLALLRERIADLPIEVEYVEDDGVETVVEANATRIVAELRPWAELARLVRSLSRADDRGPSGNHHRQAP